MLSFADNNNASPSSTGLADSGAPLRRAVGASHCGDCKYFSPQQKTLGKQGQKNRIQGPEQSVADFNLKTGKPVTEASKKIVIWIDQYPKVTLCDVAQYCDICSHNCGFVLPNVLDTKAVHCFKQDMRAGFQFWPGCLGHDKHKSEKCAPAKNGELSSSLQSEESVSQSVGKDQREMKECANTKSLSGHTTCNFLERWTTDASAPSASFLVGKCTNKGEYKTSIQNTDVEKEGPGSGTEIHTDKRIRSGHTICRSLSATQDLERINCNQTVESSIDKAKISDHSQSCVELKLSRCNSLGSGNAAHKDHCCQIDEPRKTDAAQMASEMFCERSEVDTNDPEVDSDDPESFTCQRVRAYFRKIQLSCARTYMPWPFSNSGCSLTANASTTACPADSSPTDESGTLSSQNKALMKASSDATNQASYPGKKKQEENERNRKILGDISSYSPDSTEAQESLPSRLPDTAILSISSQCGSGSHTATGIACHRLTPVNGPKTNCSMSTPSPLALGLSGWETVTTLSATSSPFTHSGLSSLSATPFLLKKVKDVELADAHSTSTSPKCMLETVEKLQTCLSPPSPNSDSSHSCGSSLILPQDKQDSDEDFFSDRSLPKLDPYYSTGHCNHECDISTEHCVEANSDEFMLMPLLSPVHSPQHSWTSFLPQSQGCSVEEGINKDLSKHKMSPEPHMSEIMNGKYQSCGEYEHCNDELNRTSSDFQTLSTLSSASDINDGIEEESQKETDYKDGVEQDNRSSEQVLLNPKVKTTFTSGVLTEPRSSPSSNKDYGGVFNHEGQTFFARKIESSLCDEEGNEKDTAEAASDTQPNVLDEFTAFEQDILLVDVIQDDPELFENLPEQGLLKLGPTRVSEAPKTRPAGLLKSLAPMIDGASLELKRR